MRLPSRWNRLEIFTEKKLRCQNADRYQHAYYKQTDGRNENGQANQLHHKDHRPRFEIRLRGDGLPCTEWSDWRNFKFESLRRDYFNFRRLKDGMPAGQRATYDDYTWHVGQKKTRPGRDGRTREFNRITEADKPLNELVRDSLRNLSKRWKPAFCKKVGSVTSDTPSKHGKSGDSSYNSTLQDDVLLSIVREIEQEDTNSKDYPEQPSLQTHEGNIVCTLTK